MPTKQSALTPVVDIVRGRLQAGDTVSPKALRDELGIPSVTISNALRVLERQGLALQKSEERHDGRKLAFFRLAQEPSTNGSSTGDGTVGHVSVGHTSVTQVVREKILAGEALTAQEAMDRYGAGRSLFYLITKGLRAEGVDIKKKSVHQNGRWVNRYGLAAGKQAAEQKPRPEPRPAGGAERAAKSAAASTPDAQRSRAEAWEAKRAFPMPPFEGTFSIAALARDEDGTRRADFRTSEGTWHTTVTGFTPA